MKKQIVRLTEDDLRQMITKSVNEVMVKQFTPYKESDRERNFKGLTHGTPESRNASYAKAKAEAEAKKAKKNVKTESVQITENDLQQMVKETVKMLVNEYGLTEGALNELDWKTNMNASKARKAQAINVRRMYQRTFPNSTLATTRNSFDNSADELEAYAQEKFNQQHNDPILTHGSERDGYWQGEKAHLTHTRKGSGKPNREYGEVYDETLDNAEGDGFTGDMHRKHTERIDKNGAKYDPNNSTVGNEVSYSKSPKYNKALDNMERDMKRYYNGDAKYRKGKGWE